MTTTIAHSRRRGGFTIVELLMVVTLSSMVLAATVSSFLLIGRSAIATQDYVEFDEEARQGLERFAREVRMAEDVTDFSSTSITMSVRASDTPYTVTYSYVAQDKAFYRAYGAPGQKVLIGDVEDFELTCFNLAKAATTQLREIKQLQLQLRSVRSGGARAFASNNVVSARYILRNKDEAN